MDKSINSYRYTAEESPASSLMSEAKEWATRLVANKIITPSQSKRILSIHCSALGSDGKSYGLSFDPIKQNR